MKGIKISSIVLLAFLAACSGQKTDQTSFDGKNLALTVVDSRSFNPNIVHGQIDYYQITISAPDLEDPIIKRFDGDATEAKMLGIPTGADRTILVEAYNPNSLVIRRGKAEGVSIIPGVLVHVDIVMNSVPIFTNLANKTAVAAGRLEFGIFGEPASRLEVDRVLSEKLDPIVDEEKGSAVIDTSNEEGLFRVNPTEEYEVGVYSFRVRDLETGESTNVAVTLYEPDARPGIALTNGGLVERMGEELVFCNSGQALYRDVAVGGPDLGGAALLDVVDMMY